jgi:hypothetical protein
MRKLERGGRGKRKRREDETEAARACNINK